MKSLLLAASLLLTGWTVAAPAHAQDAGQSPGRVIVLGKCFQCHTDAMFRDQRQDRRAWEATLYRMIGRGALWTPDEIKLMADYLGTEYGAGVRPASEPR